ncbi:MAG: hypothetical protein AAGF49_05935 [Pseudomonadota bacterium]
MKNLPLCRWVLRGVVALVVVAPVWADDRPAHTFIERGTGGTAPHTLNIENRTGRPLHCTAALAHWFSDALGSAPDGDTLTVALWHEAENGVLNRLNEGGDRMPVEAITCTAGDARARLTLPIRAGAVPETARHVCRAIGDGIACEGG